MVAELTREKMPMAGSILHIRPMKDAPEVLYRILVGINVSQALTA
ncbi:hypothetical protein SAMN05421807_101378 [Virgibacillus chiguensis]|uniref:Uncharacterized protein n=1 Tax=Virgibacillus chiguensis TaxID=411959 RepID=A0A1M5M558_9BACI|nr:hypothetical protein SAMN05421807_101378 [Virgibacillus chiguensis]